jgi:hypothetical protein
VIRLVLSADFTVTKRHLGVLLMAGGTALLAASVLVDLVRSGGFGTLQTLGVLLGTLSVIVGLTLWPLGDQPA